MNQFLCNMLDQRVIIIGAARGTTWGVVKHWEYMDLET